MSVWIAAVVAEGYQHQAELDPFPLHSGCNEEGKMLLPDELCKCYVMGHPASRLSAHDSRSTASQSLSITELTV